MTKAEVKKKIYIDLNGNDMLNIFGLVNISAVRSRIGRCGHFTDEELKEIVKELFDNETIGGVQFVKFNQNKP